MHLIKDQIDYINFLKYQTNISIKLMKAIFDSKENNQTKVLCDELVLVILT